MREPDDRVDHGPSIGAAVDVFHEAHVDLEFLGRQLAQVAEARIAGAEVVDRQVRAQFAEAAEGLLGRAGVFHRGPTR